jgi:acetyl-CoA synthetase
VTIAVRYLDVRSGDRAERIVEIARAAYAAEAALLGVPSLPPMDEDTGQVRALALHWLGAFDGERLVGFAGWTGTPSPLAAGADIDRLCVDPEWVRRGVGRALVATLLECSSGPVTVQTGAANAPALALYESLGFRRGPDRFVGDGLVLATLRLDRSDRVPPARFNLARHCLSTGVVRPPDKEALVVVHDAGEPARGAERWTFGELERAAIATGHGLLAAGLEPGDRVVLRLGNTADFPIAWLGCMAAGLIGVPTSSQLTAEEVEFVVADSGARAVAGSVGPALTSGPPLITTDDLARWRREGDHAAYRDFAVTEADEPAFLVYTSGTSGRPKGVLHAHRSAWGRRPMYAGWSGLRPDDTMLHAGALNWTYTLGVGLTDPWAIGARAVVHARRRDPSVWGRIIEETGATVFAAVPGVYRQWLRAGVDLEAIRSLRHGLTAGEALAPSLLEEWRAATGRELFESLGMSEVSTFISSGPGVPVRPGSPGRPQEGRRVAVLPSGDGAGDRTEPVPAGEVGVLAVHRSDPGMMLGYWNRPDEHPWRGEWFVTADAVHVDEDGYVHHHGRVDDILNAGGYRVSPLEVEHVLVQHPAVADVAVVESVVREGVSIIAAYAVPADPDAEEGLDAAAVLAFAREHLAAYKCPKELVWVGSLPRTANGKLQRGSLPRELREGRGGVAGGD